MASKVKPQKKPAVKKSKSGQALLEQQLEHREADLAMINSVRAALARAETQSRRLNSLNLVAQAVSSTRDLNEILEIAAREIVSELAARSCGVTLIDSARTQLEVVAFVGQEGEPSRVGIVIPLAGNPGTQQVIETRQSLVIADAQNSPLQNDAARERFKAMGTTCMLITPLVVRDEVIGTFGTDTKDPGRVFTAEEVELADTIASQISGAIQNARLYAETQQRFKETEILRAANVALTQSLDLDAILATLLDYLQQIVPYDSGSVFLLENENRLTARAARGYEHWVENPDRAIGISFDFNNIPHIRTVIKDQTTLVIPDVTQYPGWVLAETAVHVRNWLAVPLVAAGKTIGMYSLDKVQPGYFTAEHQRLAENLAAQAAIAFQNATLFRNQQVAREQAETLRAAAQALGSTLSLRNVFELILSELRKVVPYDSCSVQQLDGNAMVIVGGYGFPNLDELLGKRFDWRGPDDPAGEVVRQRKPVIIADVSARFEHFKDETHGQGRVHGWMGVPLLFGERLIGMLTLDKLEQDFYTAGHADMAQAFATQAATAIENARLFDETQRLLKETQETKDITETLYNITQVLSKTLNLQDIFDVILGELQKVVPYDSSSVQVIQNNRLVIVGGRGFDDLQALLGVGFDLDDETNPGVQVLRTKRQQVFADVSQHPHFMSQIHGGGKIRGWIGVPLIFGDRVLGVITLDKFEPDFYNEKLAEIAMAFAAQAAAAIENARLFETERIARFQAETQGRQMAALNRVAQAITSTLDLQTMLEIAAREMVELLNARSAGVGLLNDDRSELRVVAYYSRSDEPSAVGLIISMEGNIATQHVIETSQSILITDAQNTPLQDEATRAVMRARNTHCILILPLLARGEVIGTIAPDIDQPDRVFTSEDVQLAQTIANQIAGAIENARLFDESQHLLVETRKAKETAETLRSATLAFTETLNLNRILEKFLDYLALMIPYDSATIFLLEDEKQLVAHAVRGYERFFDISLAQMLQIELGSVPRIDRIVVEQKSVVIPNTTQDPTWTWVPTTMHIRSWIGVPLVASGRTIGIYSLDKAEPNFFTEEHRYMAETLAAQAAIVIEKSQLFDSEVASRARAETQSRRLNSLNRVAQAVSSTRNLNDILEIAAREIVSQLGASSCGVTLINSARTHLNVIAFAGVDGEPSTEGIVIPLAGNPGTQQVIASGLPLVIADAQNSPLQNEEAREIFKARGTTCILIIPLVVRDEVIGTFGADTNDPGRVFAQEDVELAATIASQISGAIENARLFDETQRLLKITEERAAELGAISKVSQGLIAESEISRMIQLIGSQMREIFNADIVYLALLDPHTNLIHFPYQIGETFETINIGEGLTGNIIETGQPLLINRNVLDRTREIGASPVGKEALSYLGVPIKTSKGTIGVISVQSTTQEGIFNEDSLRLLTTIAANAGAALHNAQLFSEALENLRQVEILMKAASAIQQSVYEPAMVESVAARNDALGELARVFRNMADEVRLREQRLKRQLQQLQLDIEEKQLAKAETVAVYIPMDRRQALVNHTSLPEYVQGAALFADISGFTALTEVLANELGLQRGAEEVIRQLNRVYTVLIDAVHRYGGSVINFSGDAITCWFDDLDVRGNPFANASAERAVACALAMQKDMGQFAAITRPDGKTISLSIKVALAVGTARRILVGAGTSHQIDVLAGNTLSALSDAEHHANKGEIIVAVEGLPASVSLEDKFIVSEWREQKDYALLTGIKKEVSPTPWPVLANDAILPSQAQPWMLPAVFEKVRAGKSDMLSELRQVAALFLKFSGLQYETDAAAGTQLDVFIQWVEQVIAPYKGSIIQLTVGDKGSYLYVVFGAPITYKDDASQAVLAALELAAPPESLAYITGIQIGLAYGQMRVGAYGGSSHRTYGAIGDKTNLAARLMMAAAPGLPGSIPGQRATILCDDSIFAVAQTQVDFESLPPILVKGKTQPVPIYRPVRKHTGLDADSGNALERAQIIDRLSPGEQLTLKVASVIGQLFTLEAVSAVYPEEHKLAELQNHLQTLAGLDLIIKRSTETSSYSFKDALTREVAYNLMLFAQRRQLHRAVAELLEQTTFSVPPYAEIAHHWQAADEIPKAVLYLEKAGEYAREMGNFEEASRFFNASLVLNG